MAKKENPSPINIIWLIMMLIAVISASYTGKMGDLTTEMFDSAKSAVQLAINLIGAMAIMLGIMKVAEEAGLMRIIARAMRPIMVRLFPEVPDDHPAMSAMIMNFSANALGLGNAATPMGIKAMQELDSLNPEKGTATDPMCLFLAINTSSLAILPLGVIAVRASAGAENPGAIILPSILATGTSTVVAVITAKIMGNFSKKTKPGSLQDSIEKQKQEKSEPDNNEEKEKDDAPVLVPPGLPGRIIAFGSIAALAGGGLYTYFTGEQPEPNLQNVLQAVSAWILPLLIISILLFGYLKGVKIYETVTTGAKDGFDTAVRIIPFLVAVFVAIGMIKASGAMELFIKGVTPLTSLIGMPPEALPMAFMRPLSGSGAFGVMSEVVKSAPDSFGSFVVSTMQGSTETTFYVLAVYFGSIGIKRIRYALYAGLIADLAGILATVFIARFFFYVVF